MSDTLVAVRGLTKYFVRRKGWLAPLEYNKAVDNVSFDIERGKTLAIVGESGSGKSTVGLMLLDLLEPTGGEIIYDGLSFSQRTVEQCHALRRQMQVVFQDPYSSLNARMTVAETLTEGMQIHRIGADRAEREARAVELLRRVGMLPEAMRRYPHEFSGGQRQRIAIARALSVEPKFIVLDEPTSALDVSVQSQVLNLLRSLQRADNLTYLFITHNLAVVEYLADEVVVMEHGQIVERGSVDDVFDHPQQNYTRNLLDSIPSLDPGAQKLFKAARSAPPK